MKKNFSSIAQMGFLCIIATFAPLRHVRSQPPQAAFFTFVNAVSSTANTLITVDGKALRPDGIKPGKVTGALGFAAGTHQVAVMQKAYKPASLPLQLLPAGSPIVIAYSVEVQQPRGDKTRELRLFTRPSRAQPTTSYTLIYVGQSPSVEVQVNGQPRTLKPLEELSFGSTSVSVSSNGHVICDFSGEGAGNYLGVVFDAQSNELSGAVVTDRIYQRAGVSEPKR